MKNNVCIIVLNWNGKDDTKACLDSLKSAEFEGEVVIVDNGSTDGSQEYLKSAFPEHRLIEIGENLGYAGGNNVGIEYGMRKGYSYFLILNNDTIVDPQIVQEFLNMKDAHPKSGIFGGKIYLMDEPNRFDHFGGMWQKRRIDFNYAGHRILDEGQFENPLELDYVTGAALFIRREVIDAIGLFDPRFFLFWEETDLCFRAKRAGFGVTMCPKAKLWHKVSASFSGGKPHSTYFFWRNRLLWVDQNFSGLERRMYFARLIVMNGCALFLLRAVRGLQHTVQRLLGLSTRRNEERLLRSKAALLGMRDYLKGNFGVGSSSLFH